jgi:hypothetical protein
MIEFGHLRDTYVNNQDVRTICLHDNNMIEFGHLRDTCVNNQDVRTMCLLKSQLCGQKYPFRLYGDTFLSNDG